MSSFPFRHFQNSTRVFCFLDLEHPAVAWAVMRGMMVSADYASSPPSPSFVSFMQAGIIEALNNQRIFNEFLIEAMREMHFPHRISRMRGMYFFATKRDAEARIGDPLWPNYFLQANLLELELLFEEQYTDVDANWITHAPLAKDGRVQLSELDWIRRYWSGESYAREPVWERLAKGVALILDEGIRRKCYDYVRDIFPKAHIPILMARLASEAGTRGGITAPFVLRKTEGTMQLGYLWSNAEFHDPEVIEAIARHPDSGALGRMMSENETWNLPDFRPWGRVFRLQQQEVDGLPTLGIPSLHHPR